MHSKSFFMILITSLFLITGCSMPEESNEILITIPSEPVLYCDTTPPTAGNNGTITISSLGDESFTVNWTKAVDNTSVEENLLYQLYYSMSDSISTLGDIDSKGIKVETFTADIASKTMTGLTPASTYYVNLVVKDEEGNRSIYTSVSLTTFVDFPYAYTVTNSSVYNGYYTFNGMINDRPSYIRLHQGDTCTITYYYTYYVGPFDVENFWYIEAPLEVDGRGGSSFLPPGSFGTAVLTANY